MVRFAKLPASAREVVRRVLDADDEFRSRVAVGADEAGLPRAAWLFLHRPAGWQTELVSLVQAASSADAGARTARAERDLQRRLDKETAGLRRRDAVVAVARAEVAKATVELTAASSRSASGLRPKHSPGCQISRTNAIDGYNATLSVWQELSIGDQRSRLIDACGELSARTGAEVLVVFDGAATDASLPPPRGRRRVRVQFSPPDVEADDILLDLIDGLEAGRPVTVASNDRRVRDGASARGANALSTAQLFAVLRRNPGGAGACTR